MRRAPLLGIYAEEEERGLESEVGWGIQVLQEVRLLAPKAQDMQVDIAVQELVDIGKTLRQQICSGGR